MCGISLPKYICELLPPPLKCPALLSWLTLHCATFVQLLIQRADREFARIDSVLLHHVDDLRHTARTQFSPELLRLLKHFLWNRSTAPQRFPVSIYQTIK